MKLTACFLLLSTVIIYSCGSSSSGYGEAEELYKESVKALQSKDSNTIRAFIEKALPDEGTIDFMKDHDYNYRGIPKELENRPGALDSFITFESGRFYRFALDLEAQDKLKDLKFIGFDEKLSYDTLPGKTPVPFTEPVGRCISGNDTIEYKIGELLKMNGKWKSFTESKFNL